MVSLSRALAAVIGCLLALAFVRPYHVETVDSMATSRHTHVQVAGTVALVRREADGDLHIRIRDAHQHFIVAEIVPYHPLPAPVVGQGIVVFGIRRKDNEAGHGWLEVNPVEKWIEAIP